MIKSCATIALVPEITAGPWIYWHDLERSLAHASSLGFDAVVFDLCTTMDCG